MKKGDAFSKVAPRNDENGAKPPRQSSRRRYTLEELRALNPQHPLDASLLWPEEDGPASPSPETPGSVASVWSVRATPCTAPARLHAARRADDLMTPMRAKTPATKLKTVETDSRRLSQRGKQIQYGKSTLGYRMCRIVSATEEDAPADLPKTPKEGQKCSKRCWDAQVREWRVKLHAYDPRTAEEWRVAHQLFPKETLELAAALDKNAAEFSPNQVMRLVAFFPASFFDGLSLCSRFISHPLLQCMPPADIMEEARAAAAAGGTRRDPVARSLNMDAEEEGAEGQEEEEKHEREGAKEAESRLNALLDQL